MRFTNERYWMLETIREYAGERRESLGDGQLDRRWATSVRDTVRSLEPALRRGEPWAIARIRPEQDNLRATFRWSVSNDLSFVVDLLDALTAHWIREGQGREALHLVDAIADPRSLPSDVSAAVLRWRSELLRFLGRREEAIELMEEVLPVYVERDWRRDALMALKDLAQEYAAIGDFEAARSRIDAANDLARTMEDDEIASVSVVEAEGLVEFLEGRFESAINCFETAQGFWALRDDRDQGLWVSLMVGECARRLGRLEEARDDLLGALHLAAEINARQVLRSYCTRSRRSPPCETSPLWPRA